MPKPPRFFFFRDDTSCDGQPQWPPERWYPERPSAGRSVETLVRAFVDPATATMERARLSFAIRQDCSKEAIPLLVLALDGDARSRMFAASLLTLIARQSAVPADVLRRAEAIMADVMRDG